MTQKKLAERANLHPLYISQVERADRANTIDALLKITKAPGIKLRDVVGNGLKVSFSVCSLLAILTAALTEMRIRGVKTNLH